MSTPRSTASSCPEPAQVVDPFHVVSLANRALDSVRRRVQNEQTGHRGRRDDPLYRVRRALLTGEEKLDHKATERLNALLALGDPNAEVALAYRVKERIRDFYRTSDPTEARVLLEELKDHCLRRAMPPEIQKLGRTPARLVREDLQLSYRASQQRTHRGDQQSD